MLDVDRRLSEATELYQFAVELERRARHDPSCSPAQLADVQLALGEAEATMHQAFERRQLKRAQLV